MQPKVSVVIPIYDVDEYLKECVDSVLRQTYKNIEIILVDDGSPDTSPKICDQYAKSDSRIKVIHKENGGLSDARNAGLEMAVGDYVVFVDSDDYVSSTYVEKLLAAAMELNADIVACNFYKVDGKNVNEPVSEKKERTFTNIEAMRDVFLPHSETEIMTWNKIYNIKLFKDNDIRFPVGKIHEDNFTTYKLYNFSKRAAVVNDSLYYYRQRPDSIMTRAFNEKRLVKLRAVAEAKNFVESHKLPLRSEVNAYEVVTILGLINEYIVSKHQNPEIKNKLKTALSGTSALGNPVLANRYKVLYAIANTNLSLYRVLRLAILRMKHA